MQPQIDPEAMEAALSNYVRLCAAARLLGLSEARVRQLTASGRLRAITTPAGRLWPKAGLAAYRADRAATARGRQCPA